MKSPILIPLFAMTGLVFIVWLRMLYDRVREIVVRRISPQRLATRPEVIQLLQNRNAAENFANLSELPVLFYLGCGVAIYLGNTSQTLLIVAWLFVVSRYVHSFIQCTYNRVRHRFYAYLFGGISLLMFWATLAYTAFEH